MSRLVSGRWVGGLVGRWVGGSVVGGSVGQWSVGWWLVVLIKPLNKHIYTIFLTTISLVGFRTCIKCKEKTMISNYKVPNRGLFVTRIAETVEIFDYFLYSVIHLSLSIMLEGTFLDDSFK